MAEIEHVTPGAPVRAATINSIVDALGGLETPVDSSLGYQRTSAGALITSPLHAAGNSAHSACSFMDVVFTAGLSGQELAVQLGPDLSFALDNLPGSPTSCFFKEATSGPLRLLSVDEFFPNGENGENDGWVHTGISSLLSTEKSEHPIDGSVWLHNMQTQNGANRVDVITNTPATSALEAELSSMTKLSGWESASSLRLAYTTKGKTLKSQTNDVEVPGWLVNMKTASARSAASIPGAWTWPQDENGDWVVPGTTAAKMRGGLLLGNRFLEVGTLSIPAIPSAETSATSATSASTHILLLSSRIATVMGIPRVNNPALIWDDSLSAALSGSPAVTLSSLILPVYEHDGKEPTFDWRIGTFGLPMYATW